MSTSRRSSAGHQTHSLSRGRSPATKRDQPADHEEDLWSEQLAEVVSELIKDCKISSRDIKEAENLIELLEAETLQEAYTLAYKRLKIIYIANTKGWQVASKFAREDLEKGLGLLSIDNKHGSFHGVGTDRQNICRGHPRRRGTRAAKS